MKKLMARNYFILLISFLGAVALADYVIVTGLVNFETSVEEPQNPDSSVLFRLAQKYEAGVEVELDMDKAIYWYQVAARNGSQEAKERLIALNIPLNTRPKSAQGGDNKRKKDNDVDQEAQKITKLLEQQLAREEEKVSKSKQKKKQENAQDSQNRLANERKEELQIRQSEDAKLTNGPEPQLNSGSEVATFKPSSDEDATDTTDTNTREAIPVPLALQPERPLNLPSAQKPSTTISNSVPAEQITAYDEETNTDNSNEEFTENENIDSSKETSQEEKKEFSVNPCNGPAAKFMSTCR